MFFKGKIAFLQNALFVKLRCLVLKSIGKYMVVELAGILHQAKQLQEQKSINVCV